ncbi:MAG: M16 family metallopeptidase [Candidatus Polarisedimenticolia bacterium]
MRRFAHPRLPRAASLLLLIALLPGGVAAQELEGKVRRVDLDNGMRFLLVRRGTAPVFAGTLRFRVGGADDARGATGMAHLFEHMAFKGTSLIGTRDARAEAGILDAMDRVVRDLHRDLDRGGRGDDAARARLQTEMEELRKRHQELVVKDELSQVLTRNGAVGLNASTSQDLTSYVVSLPSNRLELWCLIESARLRDPVLREFYPERDVVMEERRTRIDSSPPGKLYEQLLLTAIQAHPYRVPTVGWMSDLERLTRPAAEAFRRTYYTPGNAVGMLVGDLDPAAAEGLVRKYFGGLAAAPPPPPVVTVEPEQKGEKRVTVEFDAEPQVMIAFHKPAWPHPDEPVFDVIDALLTSGRTGRLFRRLVLETRVAADVFSFGAPGDRFPNLFVVGGNPRAPHTTAELESGIVAELRRLSGEPIPEREMQKIRNQLEADFLYPLRSNEGLAAQLSYYEILFGDWREIVRYKQALLAVTPERVADVARRTFVTANRTVAVLAREEPAAPAAAPAPAPGGAR